jgi:membrane fusion protein, multidrug efflux system
MTKKLLVKLIALVVILLAITVSVVLYFNYTAIHQNTDNAYIDAKHYVIATQINGKVQQMDVKNHQHVKKNQVLFTINSDAYTLNERATNEVLQQRQAQLKLAKKTLKRDETLFKKGELSENDLDTAKTNVDVATAANNAAAAQLKLAQLNVKHCTVRAPANGIINQLSLEPGDPVTAQQPLFSVIQNNSFWIKANYKETQLTNIKPNQKATITIDSYPNDKYHGKVISLSTGTGSAFALLPPENASGNWVKVTQRVPVWISIDNPNKYHRQFIMGQSADVTIDTSSHE